MTLNEAYDNVMSISFMVRLKNQLEREAKETGHSGYIEFINSFPGIEKADKALQIKFHQLAAELAAAEGWTGGSSNYKKAHDDAVVKLIHGVK